MRCVIYSTSNVHASIYRLYLLFHSHQSQADVHTVRVRSMNLKSAGYPRVRLFIPIPRVFFFLCAFDIENETSCSASKSASRLKNQSVNEIKQDNKKKRLKSENPENS